MKKIAFLKPKKKFTKGGFHTNPSNGWNLVLIITLILVGCGLVFGLYVFSMVSAEFVPSEEVQNGQIKIVKPERIQQVLQHFEERKEKSSQILVAPSPWIDPAL